MVLVSTRIGAPFKSWDDPSSRPSQEAHLPRAHSGAWLVWQFSGTFWKKNNGQTTWRSL